MIMIELVETIRMTQELNEPYEIIIECKDRELLESIYHIELLSHERDYGIDIVFGLKEDNEYKNAYYENNQ